MERNFFPFLKTILHYSKFTRKQKMNQNNLWPENILKQNVR